MTLNVTIERAVPDTVYRETTHEQTVVVSTQSGTTFGVFDPNLLIDDSLTNQECSLVVQVMVEDVESTHKSEHGVTPNEDEPYSYSGHRFSGQILRVNQIAGSKYEVEMDVGQSDSVLAYLPSDQLDSVTSAEFVSLSSLRADITECVE